MPEIRATHTTADLARWVGYWKYEAAMEQAAVEKLKDAKHG